MDIQNFFLNIAKNSEFLIGNSSAGIVEAASLKIPSINIGTRQDGKVKPLNVIDVKYGANEISKAIRKTKKQSFKQVLKNLKNPYEYNFTPDDVTKTIIRLIKEKICLKRNLLTYNNHLKKILITGAFGFIGSHFNRNVS